jgi:hypothetical protein
LNITDLTTGINAKLIYNDGGQANSFVTLGPVCSWRFDGYPTSPNATITAPSAVCSGSTGNTASVANAGSGATYAWSITNGTITGGQGTTQLTWTAGTASPVTLNIKVTNGAASTGSASVTLNTAPVITCPANFTLSNDPGACGAVVNFTGTHAATATGTPAPTITYSPASGTSFAVGTTTVKAKATNSCGVDSCTFTVTVVDTQKPAIACPGNKVVSSDTNV